MRRVPGEIVLGAALTCPGPVRVVFDAIPVSRKSSLGNLICAKGPELQPAPFRDLAPAAGL